MVISTLNSAHVEVRKCGVTDREVVEYNRSLRRVAGRFVILPPE
jgi:hypothetical protein